MTPHERASAEIAQEVYDEAYAWREEDGPIILAPISVAARRLAGPALAEQGIEVTEDNLADAAALLVLAFVEGVRALSEDDLASFRAAR